MFNENTPRAAYEFRTLKVDLRESKDSIPDWVEFTTSDGSVTRIEVYSFQMLREAAARVCENNRSEKLWTIKLLRGVNNGLSLKDTKDIVEYFFEHFTPTAGLALRL